MSVRLNSKLIDAAPNVVRLPTAAPRQVQQNCNRAGREARAALRKACPWPGEHLHPGQRNALRKVAELRRIEQTPALMIVQAMYALMEPEKRTELIAALAPSAVAGSKPHADAIKVLSAATMTYGEMNDFHFAMRRLDGEAR